MALISCQNLHIAFGGHPLLQDATIQMERGERIGLLGRNGEGKSTLLKIISGEINPDQGALVKNAAVRIAYMPQQIPAELSGSTESLIREAAGAKPLDVHHAERICSLLQLEPDALFSSLSGGQKRRVLLGRALACEPDLLVLDEPTNHLDIASIEWLENFLMRFAGCILFVTHDRAFLQRIATRIVELDRGQLTSWECAYPVYLRRKEALLTAEAGQWAQFDKKLAQEEAWIRQGIKARRTRNEGRVRALEQLRRTRTQRRERSGTVNMTIQRAERSGHKVITAKEVSFAYPPAENQQPVTIINQFSSTLIRGDTVGIIGPNGCGKTTLLNLLLGLLEPQQGSVEHGTRLEIAYFDQHREQLDESKSVFHNVADGNDFVEIDGRRCHVISYLQDFLFSPERIKQPVHALSGGERNRLLLARLFTRPSNVLVLDEPTNDLDTETLELLEMRLLDYPGTVLLVSHDRAFLDNLCTNCYVFEDGTIQEQVGGYSDWQRVLEHRKQTQQRQETASKAPAGQKQKCERTRKLTNRERTEWKQLPATIEQLEAELDLLQQKMADPQFFRSDAADVKAATERAKELPGIIESAYDRWAELDERA